MDDMFPSALDPESFDRSYRLKPELWRDAFLALWQAEGIPGAGPFQPFADGSNLIAAFGDWILKVFPPFLQHQWTSEWQVLQHLQGKLNRPIPELHAHGFCGNGWTFIIMSRLPGITLEKAWPRLADADKAALLHEIGGLMAHVHALPLGDALALTPAWSDFLPQQIRGCRARHERLKMPDWFLTQVDAFVQDALPLLPLSFTPVLLTGEYTPFNLLVHEQLSVKELAGMIDFGDAMIGFAEYDLLGPLLFSCEGRADWIAALLTGYGIPARDQNRTLRRRLFLLQILHRYSFFQVQLRVPNWEKRAQSCEALENLIWPMD